MNDKKKSMLPVILGCVILFAVILALGIGVMLGSQDETPTIAPTAGQVSTGDGQESISGGAALSESSPASDGTEPQAQPGTEFQQQTVTDPRQEFDPVPGTKPAPETKPTQNVTQRPTDPVIQTPETIPQQKEASYEQWLSAGMVVGLSMSYPDFQPQAIYVTGETPLEDRMSSGGAVILFTSGGKSLALCSTPLEAERKTPGTVDLSTQVLGFATFDVVDAGAVDITGLTKVEIGALEELIGQSLLVSLYWN